MHKEVREGSREDFDQGGSSDTITTVRLGVRNTETEKVKPKLSAALEQTVRPLKGWR